MSGLLGSENAEGYLALPPGRRLRSWFKNGFNRSNETVSQPWQGLDIAGRIRGIAERLPKLLDGSVEPMLEVDEGVDRPKLLPDLIPGYNFACPTE